MIPKFEKAFREVRSHYGTSACATAQVLLTRDTMMRERERERERGEVRSRGIEGERKYTWVCET